MSEDSLDPMFAKTPVWKPYWPRMFRPLWLLFAVVLFAVAALALCHAGVALVDGDWVGVVGGAVLAVAFLSLTPTALAAAGLVSGGVPRSVSTVRSETYGTGLLMRARTGWPAVILLLSFTALAWFIAAMQYIELATLDVPLPRDYHRGIAAASGGALFFMGLAATVPLRTKSDVTLYPDGIHRRSRRPRVFRRRSTDDFLRWDDIHEIQVDTFDVRTKGQTVRNPLIRLVSTQLDPSRKLERFDTHGSMVLRAYDLKAEPNTIMALVMWCRTNRWARASLAGADAARLLEAPPLGERLRRFWEEARDRPAARL